MVKIIPGGADNVLGVQASGSLTGKDYEEVMVPQLEEIINKYGKARFLCYLDDDFAGMDMGAMLDDAKFFLNHKNDFEKMAVVGASMWVDVLAQLFSNFMAGEVKTFPGDQLAGAWDWIKS